MQVHFSPSAPKTPLPLAVLIVFQWVALVSTMVLPSVKRMLQLIEYDQDSHVVIPLKKNVRR